MATFVILSRAVAPTGTPPPRRWSQHPGRNFSLLFSSLGERIREYEKPRFGESGLLGLAFGSGYWRRLPVSPAADLYWRSD